MDITTVLSFITPVHLAMVPIVIGIVGVFKNFSWFNNAYSPLVAIGFGVGLAALIGGPVIAIVIGGLIIGLSAAGLYSGVSAIRNVNA